MVQKFRVECELPLDADAFWKVKGAPAFFEFLVKDGVMARMELQKEWRDDERRRRLRCVYVPATVDVPAAVRSLVGERFFEVIDEQTWDNDGGDGAAAGVHSLRAVATPQLFGGAVTSTTTLRVGPIDSSAAAAAAAAAADDDGAIARRRRSVHVVEGVAEASIPFVGGYVEEALVRNTRMFYEAYPAHVERFRSHMIAAIGELSPDAALVDAYLGRWPAARGAAAAPTREEVGGAVQ